MSFPRPLRTEIEVWVLGFRLTAVSQLKSGAIDPCCHATLNEQRLLVTRLNLPQNQGGSGSVVVVPGCLLCTENR